MHANREMCELTSSTPETCVDPGDAFQVCPNKGNAFKYNRYIQIQKMRANKENAFQYNGHVRIQMMCENPQKCAN